MSDKLNKNTHNKVKIVNTGCCHDCGGRCVLRAHVKDGKIIAITTDNDEKPQLRACLRGRAYRQRVYSPKRLKYPLRRVGKKGSGSFERISWNEALDIVASKLKETKERFGNNSILLIPGGGNQGMIHGVIPVALMLNKFGGYTRMWGSPSYEGALFASMATYGTITTGNSREDLLNSNLIIMWGWNPANTIWDPGTGLILARAREKGIKIISIDPIYTDSAATFANQWIPIRPGTDTAVLLAFGYVIISEDLHNKEFISNYTVGFDEYKSYVMGDKDGIPKTPEWAEKISNIPADTIRKLGREYAKAKPAALIAGWGPARSSHGEQYSRAANILTALTGNIGISGGYASGFMRAYSSRERRVPGAKKNNSEPDKPRLKDNPVDFKAPPRKYSLHKLHGGTNPANTRIHYNDYYDAILQGKKGGYPADLKLGYVVATNRLNQYGNVNKGVKALKKLDFLVVHEQFMTPTAKFADIILPVNTFMERDDAAVPWLGAPYYLYLNKAIDSLYESKSDFEICKELSKRLGIELDLFQLTEEQLLRMFISLRPDIKSFRKFKKRGYKKVELEEPYIAFKEQIEDIENNPFPTLSGKIELYSEHMDELNHPELPPIPKYIPDDENFNSPKAKKYPLQLITPHNKRRTHSTLHDMPWLEEVEPHRVWINPVDARNRDIKDNDLVDVFNERGRIRIPAKVTERITPGVVCVYQGAWFNPNDEGVDIGGCANVLTRDDYSPGGAFPFNSNLVQIEISPKIKMEGKK
jgi:anaerobic dimethyl sulfoxide reductase subunit A